MARLRPLPLNGLLGVGFLSCLPELEAQSWLLRLEALSWLRGLDALLWLQGSALLGLLCRLPRELLRRERQCRLARRLSAELLGGGARELLCRLTELRLLVGECWLHGFVCSVPVRPPLLVGPQIRVRKYRINN